MTTKAPEMQCVCVCVCVCVCICVVHLAKSHVIVCVCVFVCTNIFRHIGKHTCMFYTYTHVHFYVSGEELFLFFWIPVKRHAPALLDQHGYGYRHGWEFYPIFQHARVLLIFLCAGFYSFYTKNKLLSKIFSCFLSERCSAGIFLLCMNF